MWGKLIVYTTLSAIASYGVVNHAFVSRGAEFYPAAIYLATNKASLLTLGNMAACVIVIFAAILKGLFLGSLKPSEVERVTEALKYTIPEVLIALTIFREELSLRVLSLFAMLLFSKFFHVLADERMNELEGSGAQVYSFFGHARLFALLYALLAMDALCLGLFAYGLVLHGASVLILFAFEYCLLALDVIRASYRYAIVLIAARIQQAATRAGNPAAGEWHDRSLYLLYGKLFLDLIKLGIYALYFTVLFVHYGMPIIMVRDLARSFLEVQGELVNVIAARRLRAQIMALPCPRAKDLVDRDATCSVCFGDIELEGPAPASGAAIATAVAPRSVISHDEEKKKDDEGQQENKEPEGDSNNNTASFDPRVAPLARLLPCGHMLHTSCLLQLIRRQQTCPVCRQDLGAMMVAAAKAQAQTQAQAAGTRLAGAQQQHQQPQQQQQPAAPAPAVARPAVFPAPVPTAASTTAPKPLKETGQEEKQEEEAATAPASPAQREQATAAKVAATSSSSAASSPGTTSNDNDAATAAAASAAAASPVIPSSAAPSVFQSPAGADIAPSASASAAASAAAAAAAAAASYYHQQYYHHLLYQQQQQQQQQQQAQAQQQLAFVLQLQQQQAHHLNPQQPLLPSPSSASPPNPAALGSPVPLPPNLSPLVPLTAPLPFPLPASAPLTMMMSSSSHLPPAIPMPMPMLMPVAAPILPSGGGNGNGGGIIVGGGGSGGGGSGAGGSGGGGNEAALAVVLEHLNAVHRRLLQQQQQEQQAQARQSTVGENSADAGGAAKQTEG